jgi:hypothetical protein
MRKSLIFGSGVALGYIAGTKAGTERYQQIVSAAKFVGDRTGWWPQAEPAMPGPPIAAVQASSQPLTAPLLAASMVAEDRSGPTRSTTPRTP